MNTSTQRSTAASEPESYERIKALLTRYPQTTAEENEEILIFLRRGPMLDRALLSGVLEVQPQLLQFERDHKAGFGFSLRDYLIIACIAVAFGLVLYLLWDSGL